MAICFEYYSITLAPVELHACAVVGDGHLETCEIDSDEHAAV